MSQVMDTTIDGSKGVAWQSENGKKGAEKEPLIPFDEEYPTFGRQPDFRHFAIPEHVDVSFDETFSTPQSHRTSLLGKGIGEVLVAKGFRCIFTYTMDITYYFFTVVIGFFLTLLWGITFGLISFMVVWLIQPCIKVHYIFIRIAGNMYSAIIRTFLDPIHQSCGLCFSYFRLRLNFILPKNTCADRDGLSIRVI